MRAKLWGFLLCAGLALGLAGAAGAELVDIWNDTTMGGSVDSTTTPGIVTIRGPMHCTLTKLGGTTNIVYIIVDTSGGDVKLGLNGTFDFSISDPTLTSTGSGTLTLDIDGYVRMTNTNPLDSRGALFVRNRLVIEGAAAGSQLVLRAGLNSLLGTDTVVLGHNANLQATSTGGIGATLGTLEMRGNSVLTATGETGGVYTGGGTVTLSGSAELRGDGGATGHGINCRRLFASEQAKVYGETDASTFHGILSGNIDVSGSAQVEGKATGANSYGIAAFAVDIRDNAVVRSEVTDASSYGLSAGSITLHGAAGRLEVKRGAGTGSETLTLLRDPATTSAFRVDPAATVTGTLTGNSIDVLFPGTGSYVWATVESRAPTPTAGVGGVTAADTTLPPTGDSGRMGLYLALLAIALALAGSARLRLRKR